MQIIMEAAENVVKILNKPKTSSSGYRWMTYVVECPVAEGVLLFHTLTRELLLLSRDEYQHFEESQKLRDKWFVVPSEMEDMKYADHVRLILKALTPKKQHTTSYTIFTTMDCNARCFYCYEKGCSRSSMSKDTAHEVARYIAKHCGGEKVRLKWFGGEPLFNMEIIDIISSDLKVLGVEYNSNMISNGYLFDDEVIKKALDLWKLHKIQITLDGTESVYNHVKSFIYKDGRSPYQVVMTNIGKLLDAGVRVTIRLNLDKHNEENLFQLTEELHKRFAGKDGLSVYSHVLLENAGGVKDTNANVRTNEERRSIYSKQQNLMNHLGELGLARCNTLNRQIRLSGCMADSGASLTVLPNGELGLCEHYSEDNFVGHIACDELDNEVIKRFRETIEKVDECAACFYYPECIYLKMCPGVSECFEELREENRQLIQMAILSSYQAWLDKEKNIGKGGR